MEEKSMGESRKKIHMMQQGSDAWVLVRMGKVTASKITLVKSNGKGRGEYMEALANEILTGEKTERFVSNAMMEGIEREPYARYRYQWLFHQEVKQVGFVEFNEFVGVSPDGLINDDGLLEIKCPLVKTMDIYDLNPQKLVSAYNWQVQMQLWVTDRKWCDLFAWNPECDIDFVKKRVFRDEKAIRIIEASTEQFIKELKMKIKFF